LVFMALIATELGAAVGQHPRQPDAVLVIKRHHPAIEDLVRGDRCLAIVQLGEGDLGVGVDEGLLIDPANALQRADIEGVLRPAVAWALAVELAMRRLVRLGFPRAHFGKHASRSGPIWSVGGRRSTAASPGGVTTTISDHE